MSAPLRFGVMGLVRDELLFVFALARHLGAAAEFLHFQPRPDLHDLSRAHDAQFWTPAAIASRDHGMDDAELLTACGTHELYWARDLDKLRAEAHTLAGSITVFLLEQAIDCVLVWNGTTLTRALSAHIARKIGIRIIYCENGYLPGTMQIDHGGVNFNSSFTPAIGARAYLEFEGDEAALQTALNLLRSGRKTPGVIAFPQPKARPAQRLRRELRRLVKPQAWRWLDSLGRADLTIPRWSGAQPFVLLPLQVINDSQLSAHSPLLGHHLPRLVLQTWLAMRRVLPDHRLVVKLHPRETTAGNRAYLKLAVELPEVMFVNGQPMHELLRDCDLVVTINSTVGVEAMAFDKPVVTLGRNFYTFPELVHPVDDLDKLGSALRLARERVQHQVSDRRAFLRYLHQRVLTRCSYRDAGEHSIAVASARLLELTG